MSREITILVIGGFCAGKSTLARKLLELHGGILPGIKKHSLSADGFLTVVGDGYETKSKCPGTDKIPYSKDILGVCEQAQTTAVLIEGYKLASLGALPLQLLFMSPKQLVVNLATTRKTLEERRLKRDCRQTTEMEWEQALKAARVLKKYKKIGVPVCNINTDNKCPDEIAQIAERAICIVLTSNTNGKTIKTKARID